MLYLLYLVCIVVLVCACVHAGHACVCMCDNVLDVLYLVLCARGGGGCVCVWSWGMGLFNRSIKKNIFCRASEKFFFFDSLVYQRVIQLGYCIAVDTHHCRSRFTDSTD